MGKIGDLIVRLKLHSQDYEKGLKKAEKETKGFGASLSKGIGLIKTAWAAVGVAAVAAGKKLVDEMKKASNAVGDVMNVKAQEIGAVWHTMITSITSGFDNFLNRARAASKAAKALAEMEDAEYEMLNSTKLMRSELELQKTLLEIDAKNATKGYDERIKAAKEYLKVTEDIYKIEEDYYKKLAAQGIKTWLESSSTPKGSVMRYNESNAAALYRFLKEYGHDTGLQDAVKNYRQAWNEAGELWNRTASGKAALKWVNENRQDWGQTQYRRFALDLGWSYEEQHNDTQNGAKLVDYIDKYLQSTAAYNSATKKMQTMLNSLQAAYDEELKKKKAKVTEDIDYITGDLAKLQNITASAVSLSIAPLPDIIPDDWLTRNREKIDAAVEEAMRLQSITAEINSAFESAIASSLSGATQAITDCIAGIEGADASQVLAALLQPFANTMTQLGEMLIIEGLGIQAFKDSLKSLQPGVALAAGAALLAMGAALSSGIKMLGANAGGTTASASASNATSDSSSIDRYQQEIVVKVVGEIAGDKIILAGERTLNKWNR